MTVVDFSAQVLAVVAPVVVAGLGIVGAWALVWLKRKLRVEAVAAERADVRGLLRVGAAAAEETAARVEAGGPFNPGGLPVAGGGPPLSGADKARLAIGHALAQYPDLDVADLARELDGQLAMMAGVGATGGRVVFEDAGPTDPERALLGPRP